MARPHPVSHRYQNTGPIISDETPSMAGVILAEVEKSVNGTELGEDEDPLDEDDEEEFKDWHSGHLLAEGQKDELEEEPDMNEPGLSLGSFVEKAAGSKRKSAQPMRIGGAKKKGEQSDEEEEEDYGEGLEDKAEKEDGAELEEESLSKRLKTEHRSLPSSASLSPNSTMSTAESPASPKYTYEIRLAAVLRRRLCFCCRCFGGVLFVVGWLLWCALFVSVSLLGF